MGIRIDRESFLRTLESVQPGLSPKGVLEQSDAFVFRGGKVMTFNEEVFCRAPSGLPKGVTGAVRAAPLLGLLGRMAEAEVEIEVGGGAFTVLGKRRGAPLTMEAEIGLPVEAVEKPEHWKPLPDGFLEAVNVVSRCASGEARDRELYHLCVNVAPKHLEAFDKTQFCRWRIRTGVDRATLVRQSAIKHVGTLGMTKMSQTENWLHFRNAEGLRLSCRRYVEDFPELGQYLEVTGKPLTLPKGLARASETARIFSSENGDADLVLVEIGCRGGKPTPGKMRITGRGVSGEYWEEKRLAWDGKPLAFYISPLLLKDVVERHPECVVSEDRIVIDGGPWKWVTVLGKVQEADDKPEQDGKEIKRRLDEAEAGDE